MSEPEEIAVLRERLNSGMAFLPAKLVRVLLVEYDARGELPDAIRALEEVNTALGTQARIAESRRAEHERSLREIANELATCAAQIREELDVR
jgi:hypothetical protein